MLSVSTLSLMIYQSVPDDDDDQIEDSVSVRIF